MKDDKGILYAILKMFCTTFKAEDGEIVSQFRAAYNIFINDADVLQFINENLPEKLNADIEMVKDSGYIDLARIFFARTTLPRPYAKFNCQDIAELIRSEITPLVYTLHILLII